MTMRSPEVFEARLAALEQSRRRERAISGSAIAVLLIALHSWSPAAQPQKPLDERVEDLEKRLGGAGGIGEAMRIRAPFVVTDNAGRSLFSVTTDADSALVMVGPPTEPGITLSLDPTSSGYINLRGKGGELAIGLGGKPAAVRVFAPNGGDVVASLGVDEGNNGELQIGDPKGGGAEIGMGGTSGAGVVLVRRRDGSVGAGVGQFQGGPMSMVVFNGDKEAAILSSDKTGGRVRVMNGAGTAVGGLVSDAAGGRLALTGANGGNSLLSMGATADGGSLSVFSPSGGSARATLAADGDSGAVTIFNPAGLGVAWLESGDSGNNGRMVIARDGNTMVEAGILNSGIGIVRTGPGGRAGGGMGIPGSFIMGKQ